MLDIARLTVVEYGKTLDLMNLADTVAVATVALHAFSRPSAMVRLRHCG